MQMYTSHERRNLTGSMLVILLKDRSSQPSFDGWARKWPSVYWRPTRSVMLLLLRRKEQLRYLPFEFVCKGRKPLRGTSDKAPEKQTKIITVNIKCCLTFLEYLYISAAQTSISLFIQVQQRTVGILQIPEEVMGRKKKTMNTIKSHLLWSQEAQTDSGRLEECDTTWNMADIFKWQIHWRARHVQVFTSPPRAKCQNVNVSYRK